MKNNHIKKFIKCGFLNNFIISIISNYDFKNNIFELDYIILYYIKKIKCKSLTINYQNYKFASCLSTENIICHGIPVIENILFNYIKIDVSIKYNNLCSDCCFNSNKFYKKKNFYFKNFFYNTLNFIKLNSSYSFINNKLIKNKFFFINEDYCSHGIFKNLHNNLIIYHCNKNNYVKIKNFDSFTIEPMFILKNKDGYNYKNIFFSKKDNLSFQWEHTMYFLKNSILITTLRKNELWFI
ncbi:MAG: hypothetical protein NVS84_00100 [Candidatus Carsonella ruddii]|nr:MAG: hypothetical protein NVS84_00100 [Candidatus Carsonella ruddii]WMC19480.1 MAG: hypothetical protein NVS85_00100 [Candidatus Carsonella ruddii]